ncbi:acylphosphatase [Gephyromycinifex aptenodytis]|uniref:acylphosphatase n=1 Tax=Gephyromycinifex aptenodytis TaxID=2716227 RepID=UPI0014486BD8|nr:acylphosphatase [Gephyromycinifex aptenodytis]
MERATIFVSGTVQGVGFRWWTRARALELGLVGFARNLPDGRVEVLAQGERADVERLEELLREKPSTMRRPGRVTTCTTQWGTPRSDLSGFVER